MTEPNGRRRIRFLAKLAFSLGALALLVAVAGPDQVIAALATTNVGWLIPLYLLATLVRFSEAAQMQLLLRKANTPVRLVRVVLANLLSSFYALLLPGDIVASGAKWSNLAAATGKRSLVLNAIVYNRLALLLPGMIIGAFALAAENPLDSPWLPFSMGLCTLAGILVGLLLWHPRSEPLLNRLIRPVALILPHGLKARLEMLVHSMRGFRAFSIPDHATVLSVGVLSAVLSTGLTVISFYAIGIDVSIATMVWIHAVLIAIRQIPITVSGIGVREGLLVALLAPYGVGVESAIALGLLKFSTNVLVGSAGGIYQLALSVGWAEWKSPIAPKAHRTEDGSRPG